MLTRTRSLDAITTIDLHGRLGVEDGGALPEAVREFLNVGRREVVVSRLRAPVERRLVTLTGVPVPTENSIGLTGRCLAVVSKVDAAELGRSSEPS
jgi:hypothetical protein